MKLPKLPPPNPSIRDDYLRLIDEIDRLAMLLTTRLRKHIICAPGCSSCCRQFSVVPLEAALIAQELGRQTTEPAAPRTDESACGLLVADLCSVYARRPIICRTQGLPIAYLEEERAQIEVSACPLNFTEDHPFSYEDLFFLDPFNGRLMELNRRYCLMHGLDPTVRIAPWPGNAAGPATGTCRKILKPAG